MVRVSGGHWDGAAQIFFSFSRADDICKRGRKKKTGQQIKKVGRSSRVLWLCIICATPITGNSEKGSGQSVAKILQRAAIRQKKRNTFIFLKVI